GAGARPGCPGPRPGRCAGGARRGRARRAWVRGTSRRESTLVPLPGRPPQRHRPVAGAEPAADPRMEAETAGSGGGDIGWNLLRGCVLLTAVDGGAGTRGGGRGLGVVLV